MTALTWQELEQTWILMPSQPRGILHFLGGAFTGLAPQIVYSALLEDLADAGYGILAPRYTTDTQHRLTAHQLAHTFLSVQDRLGLLTIPTFGLGHSLGCKLHLLACVAHQGLQLRRRGNIFIAYSNSSYAEAVPWGPAFQSLSQRLGSPDWLDPGQWIGEFDPSPAQTRILIEVDYTISSHLLVKLDQDSIDDMAELLPLLQQKFGSGVTYRQLVGNHGTSAGGPYPFKAGDVFTPLDALGQFVYETLNQSNRALLYAILGWLHTMCSVYDV